MSKILVIAEKPSVALDISKVLQCKTKGEGCYVGEQYIVSWAIGHLISLCDPEDYDPALKKWRRASLPIIPDKIRLKPVTNTKKQLNVLEKLMNSRDTEYIICATDSGREGELIFRYIYEYIKCNKKCKRLWISSMTDAAIKDGFAKIRPSEDYDNLYYSARCRSEADWLVGINATRAYTLKHNALLSVGRVQTPTLAIIVNRQKEIDAFVPKDYWQIKADFSEYFGLWTDFEGDENKIFDIEKAKEIAEKVKGKPGEITQINTEKKSQPPGLLYDLTLLQRECNRKYGYSAQNTLTIAQDLYEKRKLITYPRTDSQYLSADMKEKVAATVDKLDFDPYSPFVAYIKGFAKLPSGKRIFDDKKVTDHHAIIPTDKRADLSKLSESEINVYNMIARKFLAAFYPNYIYNVTKIHTFVEGEGFLTQGNTVVQLGWRELFIQDNKSEKNGENNESNEEEQTLPDVKKGDLVTLKDAELLTKKTLPPKAYNEELLLAAMENAGRFVEDEQLKEKLKESGIGTPATRAAIIERIIKVGYITRMGKTLVPTEKGMKLIEIVPHELKSPETTGKWEKGLSSIAKGNMQSEKFMASIGRYVSFIINDTDKNNSKVIFSEEKARSHKITNVLGQCPLCKEGDILENSKAYYCSRWKAGCKLTVWKDILKPYGADLSKELMSKLLKEGHADGINITLPQTKEKCIANLVVDIGKQPVVQLINVNRLDKE